eukprot:g40602.t1
MNDHQCPYCFTEGFKQQELYEHLFKCSSRAQLLDKPFPNFAVTCARPADLPNVSQSPGRPGTSSEDVLSTVTDHGARRSQ